MLGFLVFISIKQMGRWAHFSLHFWHVHSRSPSEEVSRSLHCTAIRSYLHAGLWSAWWTCSARLLNGQPDWECINIRAKGRQGGLIREERGWREWLWDKYCECKSDWKSVWWKEIDCPNQRNSTTEPQLPCLCGFWGLSGTQYSTRR